MIYLLWISMFLMTYVCGKAFLSLISFRRKMDYGMTDFVLTGLVICIGIAEAAHLAIVFTHRSFSEYIRLMEIAYLAVFLMSCFWCLYGRMKKKRTLLKLYKEEIFNRTAYYLGFVTLVIILIQFVIIQINEHIYLDGDMTVETVNTLLSSNRMYEVDPLTGAAYTEGVPLRIRILCLPSLYAFFTYIFRMNAIDVVWQAVPAFVLLCSYVAFWGLGKVLFPQNIMRRNLFLLLVAFLLTVGDYGGGMDGFLLLQSGFRGIAIRTLILVPFLISAVIRKKWVLAALCIFAEACIVWTFYGAGVCLLVAAGLLTAEYVLNRGKKPGQTAKKE